MRRALVYARDLGALVMPHVHEPTLVGDGVMNEGELSSRLGLAGIPREAETIMLERDLRLVRLTGARYHAAMISCADSVEIVRRAKEAGLAVTCGVSINNLSLNENDVGDYKTFCKLSPPLRHEDDRQAVIAALAEGVIDVIVSDHNPQDVETKRLALRRGRGRRGRVWRRCCRGPQARPRWRAQIGLPALCGRSRLAAGRDPRLPGSPPCARGAGRPDRRRHRPSPSSSTSASCARCSKNSPFDEARLEGRVLRTFVAGRVVSTLARRRRGGPTVPA